MKPSRPATLASIAALAALPLLPGCGGSDSNAGGKDRAEGGAPTATSTTPRKRAKRRSERAHKQGSKRSGGKGVGTGSSGGAQAPGGPSTQPAPTPSGGASARSAKRAFIAKADAVCSSARKQAAKQRGSSASDTLRRSASVIDRSMARLEAIGIPAADRSIANAYVAAERQNARLLRELATAVDRQDRGTGLAVTIKLQRNGVRTERLARRYGFRVCGRAGR